MPEDAIDAESVHEKSVFEEYTKGVGVCRSRRGSN